MKNAPGKIPQKMRENKFAGALDEARKWATEAIKQRYRRHASKGLQQEFGLTPSTAERALAGQASADLLLILLRALEPDAWAALIERANIQLGEEIAHEIAAGAGPSHRGTSLLARAQVHQAAAAAALKERGEK